MLTMRKKKGNTGIQQSKQTRSRPRQPRTSQDDIRTKKQELESIKQAAINIMEEVCRTVNLKPKKQATHSEVGREEVINRLRNQAIKNHHS